MLAHAPTSFTQSITYTDLHAMPPRTCRRAQEELRNKNESTSEPVTVDSLFDSSSVRPSVAAAAASVQEATLKEKEEVAATHAAGGAEGGGAEEAGGKAEKAEKAEGAGAAGGGAVAAAAAAKKPVNNNVAIKKGNFMVSKVGCTCLPLRVRACCESACKHMHTCNTRL